MGAVLKTAISINFKIFEKELFSSTIKALTMCLHIRSLVAKIRVVFRLIPKANESSDTTYPESKIKIRMWN